QMDLLNANKSVTGQNTGLNMDQLTKMYDFYATKMNDLANQQIDLEQKEKKLNENIARLQNQLNELNSKFNQPTGEIVASITSSAAKSVTFEFSFLMPDAGWSPIYDIRSQDVHGPVTLNYKANVYQNSGTDWNNVKVKLSTGNPAVSATGPTLYPWYVNIYQPPVLNEMTIAAPSRVYNKADNAAAAPAMDTAGLMARNTTGANYTTATQTQLNAEFDISIPYDIPSDGKSHLIAIQDYELPATYSYYAVPKLDNDAFLTADISNWEDLNLLPGNANIFFQGSYVGQSYVNPVTTKDTLSFSLGRDKNIVIKREKVKDFSKPKTIGDNIKQSFAYTISIKNMKKDAIDMKIMDQFPISQNSKIEVTLDDAGGASVNSTEGKLTWMVHLESGAEKKLQYSFTVKYPKDQTIAGL
ncbi:MAG: mucoidy inhibitor MuiA family protein, partial [Chitinophagales bacterium]